jgi:hypothetical protein
MNTQYKDSKIPEAPTFYEKDRLKAKKQISRRELFKKI